MSFLAEIESALRGAGGLSEVLRLTLEHFDADTGTIHLLESDPGTGSRNVMHLKAASQGIPQEVLAAVQKVPIGKGMAGLAVERKQPVSICNLQTDTGGDVRPGAKKTGMEGAIVVPILHGDEAVGALGIANRKPRTFDEQEIDTLLATGRVIAQFLDSEPRFH